MAVEVLERHRRQQIYTGTRHDRESVARRYIPFLRQIDR